MNKFIINDIWLNILCYFDFEYLVSIMRTCKLFYNLVHSDFFWKYKYPNLILPQNYFDLQFNFCSRFKYIYWGPSHEIKLKDIKDDADWFNIEIITNNDNNILIEYGAECYHSKYIVINNEFKKIQSIHSSSHKLIYSNYIYNIDSTSDIYSINITNLDENWQIKTIYLNKTNEQIHYIDTDNGDIFTTSIYPNNINIYDYLGRIICNITYPHKDFKIKRYGNYVVIINHGPSYFKGVRDYQGYINIYDLSLDKFVFNIKGFDFDKEYNYLDGRPQHDYHVESIDIFKNFIVFSYNIYENESFREKYYCMIDLNDKIMQVYEIDFIDSEYVDSCNHKLVGSNLIITHSYSSKLNNSSSSLIKIYDMYSRSLICYFYIDKYIVNFDICDDFMIIQTPNEIQKIDLFLH